MKVDFHIYFERNFELIPYILKLFKDITILKNVKSSQENKDVMCFTKKAHT